MEFYDYIYFSASLHVLLSKCNEIVNIHTYHHYNFFLNFLGQAVLNKPWNSNKMDYPIMGTWLDLCRIKCITYYSTTLSTIIRLMFAFHLKLRLITSYIPYIISLSLATFIEKFRMAVNYGNSSSSLWSLIKTVKK